MPTEPCHGGKCVIPAPPTYVASHGSQFTLLENPDGLEVHACLFAFDLCFSLNWNIDHKPLYFGRSLELTEKALLEKIKTPGKKKNHLARREADSYRHGISQLKSYSCGLQV